MLTQNQIKQIKALHQKKFRNENKQFIAEGPLLVEELLGSKFTFEGIYGTKEWIAENSDRLQNKNIPFFEINEKDLERISALKTPNNVLAVLNIPEQNIPSDIFGKELILVLDEIKDPGNLGTIIRTANWFGIGNIFCSENSTDLFNPKVVQATMGSIAKINVCYTNLSILIKEKAKNVNIYGAFAHGENIYNIEPDKNGVIIIGNESAGISDDLQKLITKKISIPLHHNENQRSPESLNASVAAAILCYEFRRK
ncbi:MAG: RNA methyltransferase [Bacteroidetes bacterium]|nr:RNA methyltransferase [Bacteroidota bacterium]